VGSAYEINHAVSVYGYLMSAQTASAILHFLEPLQVGYGAVILSFLGAIHWGFEWASYGGNQGYPPTLLRGVHTRGGACLFRTTCIHVPGNHKPARGRQAPPPTPPQSVLQPPPPPPPVRPQPMRSSARREVPPDRGRIGAVLATLTVLATSISVALGAVCVLIWTGRGIEHAALVDRETLLCP